MSKPSEMNDEWKRKLNPSILNEVCFWAGVLWGLIAVFLTASKSSGSSMTAFTACMFFIAASNQLARKRMNALLEWIEYQKAKEKPLE